MLRLTTRMQQSIDYGSHKGAQPKIVTKRAVAADIDTDDAQARDALVAAGLPRRDASPIAWARFLHDVVPTLERQGWRVEIDPSVNELVVDASAPHAIWDARLAAREPAAAGRFAGEAGEWFDVDLGVEVDGQRIALLPVIVDALRSMDAGVMPQGDVTYAMSGERAVVLPMERIRAVLQTLVELHDDPHLNARGKLALSRLSALELAQAVPDVHSEDESAQALQALAAHLTHGDGVAELPVPHDLRATLREYQHEGYRWLQFLLHHSVGGILADDMGLGKSIQAIAHLLTEHPPHFRHPDPLRHPEPVEGPRATSRGEPSGLAIEPPASLKRPPSLLVVPTSLVPNWLAEIERFAPSLRVLTLHGAKRFQHYAAVEDADVAITTYALLTRDEFFLHQPWHIAILDEAQAIKNANSKVARAAAKLKAAQRLCLTGTPMENHLGELWSLLNFVMPHALYDQRRFARLFRTPIEKENSSQRRDQLARRIRPFILRRTKADVALQLPEKTEIVERIELAEDQRDLYESVRLAVNEEVRREIERLGLARSRIAVLDALLKLRQVCCDPRLVKLESAARVHSSAKLAWLVENLEQLVDEGRRTLVFSQFTSMIDLMKRELDRANIKYVELVGSTVDRATPVRRFQSGEVPVFLISLRAGGTGLNLTAADTVIHYDPWWNPAVERQATDRAHRIGQDKPVFVYKLIAAGTVEEKILDLQARKADIAESLFEATGASSIDLRPEDIEALLS
jgi:SNF2 family DNA or RNA helicase